jgi:hypothetical protein
MAKQPKAAILTRRAAKGLSQIHGPYADSRVRVLSLQPGSRDFASSPVLRHQAGTFARISAGVLARRFGLGEASRQNPIYLSPCFFSFFTRCFW